MCIWFYETRDCVPNRVHLLWEDLLWEDWRWIPISAAVNHLSSCQLGNKLGASPGKRKRQRHAESGGALRWPCGGTVENGSAPTLSGEFLASQIGQPITVGQKQNKISELVVPTTNVTRAKLSPTQSAGRVGLWWNAMSDQECEWINHSLASTITPLVRRIHTVYGIVLKMTLPQAKSGESFKCRWRWCSGMSSRTTSEQSGYAKHSSLFSRYTLEVLRISSRVIS